jgi:hypothetical protein
MFVIDLNSAVFVAGSLSLSLSLSNISLAFTLPYQLAKFPFYVNIFRAFPLTLLPSGYPTSTL